ncbi:urease accessory protein UreF [Mycolicibacterium porcinum]|uniref:Urease accessory protein UreF n=1 Tax=Mycolicibacterium porcinum TaxID=39693 RepID=A0AAW5SW04_9MYCO|nr:urease accessory UreF family protein [Mycolicibacterium porcinum]MCV7387239.1 urease accessory protein UreF [Mycolicibacterium porcinum]ORB42662.1 urease accessory protein UreF [Mycolicibacterium porcinum]CDO31889.1 urease accessory protein UreF [Mycolicibacterium vulneris]
MPATTTDPDVALTRWMQLHDSAFPAGRMVHSHGLEEWLAARPGADAAALETAVCGYLTHGFGPLDATVTAHAWLAADSPRSLSDLDELTGSYKLFDNARTASTSTGRQLAATAVDIGIAVDHQYLVAVRDGKNPGHAAVVDGVVQAQLGVPQQLAVLGAVRSMMASMLSAAVRLGRLGPLQSQRIQLRNADLAVRLARESCQRPLQDLSGTAPGLEISGMRHEERTSRLFAT